MTQPPDHHRDLVILEQIDQNPEATQATLASNLGVAVGTINWHLKRLIAKGYVKVRRVERRKLLYMITPEGLALRARLTVDYIQNSFQLYRLVRERVLAALIQVRQSGFTAVCLESEEGDVHDVCRLTCLEQGIGIVSPCDGLPRLEVRGLKVFVYIPVEPVERMDEKASAE